MSILPSMEKLLEGVEVEWKALGEVVHPTKNIRWKTTDDVYQYIDLTSVCRERKVITETISISAQDAPSRAQKLVETNDVLFATTRPAQQRYCLVNEDYDGQVASTGYCVLRAIRDVVSPKWILYWVASNEFKIYVEEHQAGSAYPAISDAKVKEFKIPIPPINVQAEIVRILDAFTAYTAELTAELTARKKQYNHYRDQLLSFSEAEVEWKTLGEIAELRRGRVMSKGYLVDNAGDYPVYSSQTANNGEIGRINTYDFDGEFINWTTDGANAGTVFYRNGKFSITNVSGLIKLNNGAGLNYRYLYHWLTTEAFKHVYSGMGNPKLMSHQVEKIPVPIISLEKQARIVAILDKFDALTASISEGLPREIELRQKQYEYYRDRLLSFPKPACDAAA